MENFDKIIFQDKNRSYGAYDLRKRYFKHVTIGLSISVLCFVTIAMYFYVLSLRNANSQANDDYQQMVADYEQYAMLKDVDSLVVQSAPKKLVSKQDNLNYKVVDSLKKDKDTLRVLKVPDQSNDSLNNGIATSDTSREGSDNGVGNSTLWVRVGQLPKPPCGLDGLTKFQIKNTRYPVEAYGNKIQGEVSVEVYVKKEGTIDKISISKSVNPYLDKEALRVTALFIKTYPKWIPGKRNGKAVNFLTYIKYTFQM